MQPETRHASLLIRGGTIIAFDGQEHRQLEGGVVAIEGDRILHVGTAWQGTAARIIEADGRIVIPGQVSTHAHVGTHEGPRLLIDAGRRDFVRSGFLHFLPVDRAGGPGFSAPADARASLRYGFATLLRHGVTTVLAFAPAGADGGALMLEVAAEMGIRLVWSPLVSGGRYWREADGRVTRAMDEAMGLRQVTEALRFIEKLDPKGLVGGVLTLDEYYVSTPTLRREAKAAARAAGVPFTLHFVEQHREFFETMAETGRTPVQLLAEEGVLDSATILAHCIYHAGHSLVGYPMADDLAILGAAGATVAHSPVAFSRRGVALESFDRFRRAGIGMALGTDTYPLDMFSEMRMAALMGKLVDRNYEAAPAGAVFAASNLGGAAALGRPDLGRIAAGAQADLVLVDPRRLTFGINPDPIRALVHLATPDMVQTVVVAGRVVVEDGRLAVADEDEILEQARQSSGAVWSAFAASDRTGRSLAEAYAPTLSAWVDPA
jgi:cytosine/adenosine deaminase-related metal-dependent hydrolase